jgi:quinoprotein glucose dehydrogenase
MPEIENQKKGAVVAIRVLAVLLAVTGLVLLIGGIWLLSLGGSFYYALAGLGLAASAVLLWQLRVLGAWIYIALFGLTLVWAVWEAGLNGWALVPRLAAPAVLLAAVIAAFPVLDNVRGRRFALGGAAGLVAGALILGLVVAQASRPLPPEGASTASLVMDDPALRAAGEDWPAYGGTESARRYSPLAAITPENVGQLERVWSFRTGDIPEEKWGAETTPLKIGDTLYLCTARNILIALDAGTGRCAGATIRRCRMTGFPTRPPAAAWPISRPVRARRTRPAVHGSSRARLMAD